jgi:ribosomal protein L13
MTKFVKKDQVTSSWYEIDATNAVVGRLATVISKIIRGKNKTTYTPHMDHGDFVVVKNIEQAKFTGKKFQDKIYYRHTGHPGGIKETTPEKLHEKKPGETLKLAVKRMLPGGVLGRKQLTKLKIYSGSDHPHAAQNPQVIELGKLNSKNLVEINMENTQTASKTPKLKLDFKDSKYATGRRKTSIAKVWLKKGSGKIYVNGKLFNEYFSSEFHHLQITRPFDIINQSTDYDVRCSVSGGGPTGQAGALVHGISKALVMFDENLKSTLKTEKLTTRDSRAVERKKPGRRKARRSFQFSKR